MNLDKLLEEVKLITALDFVWNKETKNHDEVQRPPHAFIQNDRGLKLMVSAEDGGFFADYYGEYNRGCPWIHEELEAFATKHKCFWEWRDPGTIVLYEA